MRLPQPKQAVSLKNELRNRWTEAWRTGCRGIARPRSFHPLARVTIPRKRHSPKARAGSFLKRPDLLLALSRPKRTREITFGELDDLPEETLPRDELESLFAHRRRQNQSGQIPTPDPKWTKPIKLTA